MGAALEWSHRALLLQQRSPSQLCQTQGFPGSRTARAATGDSAHSSPEPSWTGSAPSPRKVAPALFPDPSLFLARLPASVRRLPPLFPRL